MGPDGGLWRAPHLSLFLLAALWAALVPLVWLMPGQLCDPVAWHRQELILGVAGAAMGGYLLTALPHWIGPGDVGTALWRRRPTVTRLMVLAWGLGRIFGGSCQPDALALVGLWLYPLALAAALVLPVVAARVWRRLPIALAPLLLGLIALRLRLAGDSLSAVLGLALLVSLVGGRIVPAFLRARAGDTTARRIALPGFARLADLGLVLALFAPLLGVGQGPTGFILLAAAMAQGLRVLAWPLRRGLRGRQADLALLLVAWAWMPAGLGLLGVSLAFPTGPTPTTALHGLTMGLMGSMVLAVMARAWMIRLPGTLRPGPGLCLAFALVQLATLLRLVLPQAPIPAALCWSTGWTLATAAALLALFRPVPSPVLSARRLAVPSAEADEARSQPPVDRAAGAVRAIQRPQPVQENARTEPLRPRP